MQFPNTMQTARTEAFMAEWRKMNPEASTSEYNRKFSETYARFGSDPDAESPGPVRQSELMEARICLREEELRRQHRSDVESVMRAKDRALRRECRQPKHRPQTKGAYGKSRRR
jgi:4-alpha-glucanotransferase